MKLYMQIHGDMVNSKKIEIIRKDVGGIKPPLAKQLAAELVTRDNVDVLAGNLLTPNALAVAAVSADAENFTIGQTQSGAVHHRVRVHHLRHRRLFIWHGQPRGQNAGVPHRLH
ncbi:MAG: hypothetical protein JKX91_09130 [Rhizobiaceae bacterium]|nr:hypothetical protein [Rhizobiaceae bacterium]